jgi:hypothetical protein
MINYVYCNLCLKNLVISQTDNINHLIGNNMARFELKLPKMGERCRSYYN